MFNKSILYSPPPPQSENTYYLTVANISPELIFSGVGYGYISADMYTVLGWEGGETLGAISNNLLFDTFRIIGCYGTRYYAFVLTIEYSPDPTPDVIYIIYNNSNNYARLTLYGQDDTIIIYASPYSSDDLSDGSPLEQYISQTIPINFYLLNSNRSEKVKVSFYYKSPRNHAIDDSDTWYLRYADDPNNEEQQIVYKGSITPEDGTLLAELEVDTYRDCYIYKVGGYGGSDESLKLIHNESSDYYYEPVSYMFMVTKSCNVYLPA